MEPGEVDEEIRQARARGELLGPLTDKYGAAAVVRALGVMGVAHILGLDEPIRGIDYDTDDDYAEK